MCMMLLSPKSHQTIKLDPDKSHSDSSCHLSESSSKAYGWVLMPAL